MSKFLLIGIWMVGMTEILGSKIWMGKETVALLPSITMYMNGNGILNNSDILLKSSTVEDVEDVVTTKATSIGKIGTEEEESPPHILIEKGHASGGGKKGKEVE
jgi:hypothetical protein